MMRGSSTGARFYLKARVFKNIAQPYGANNALLHSIVAVGFLLSVLILIINGQTHHFTTMLPPAMLLLVVPVAFILWVLSGSLYALSPRLGLLVFTMAEMCLYLVISAVAIAALLTTPFPIIDHQLLKVDEYLGFSTQGLMAWVHQYPWLLKILEHVYAYLYLELAFTPLLLALFNDRLAVDRYILATFVAALIAIVIYYFWPTVAPAGVISSPFFNQDQLGLVQRFVEVHNSQPVTVFVKGLIAFPSIHVASSLIILVAWRKYPWIFFPLIVINSLVVFSTVALGYHYLVDALAGFMLAFLALIISRKCIKKV